MRRLTEQAHELCSAVIAPGDVVVDATAGNGHDTLFLARRVGSEGIVFAFDLQTEAIDETANRLQREGVENVVLLQADHANLKSSIPAERHGRIAAMMFNLGYRPGGNKSVITRPTSTLHAIEQSLALLRPGGILTVICYPGHAGGNEETIAVRRFLKGSPPGLYDIIEFPRADKVDAPVLFAATRR